METQPTVYIVDDDQAVRDALAWLVESIQLQAKVFDSAQAFINFYSDDMPGCLVLDVRLPGMSGLELQQRLVAEGIDIPTIIITGHADVPMAVSAIKTGAIDFVEKPFGDQELLDRIHVALARDASRRAEKADRERITELMKALTAREAEVMDWVIRGLSNKQVAEKLEVSYRTVEVHRKRVMEKMQAESLAELVRMALTVQPELVGEIE